MVIGWYFLADLQEAIAGDVELIEAASLLQRSFACARIRKQNEPLANALTSLANNFEYDAILNLIEKSKINDE